ncbi:hypothetical protein Tco_0630483, partial [Tanacetum coccineum]
MPTAGIVIRETPVETKTKRKENVDVTRGKGIEMLSEVALTEEAQMKEVRKKSLRDFHMTHPSSSGRVSENPPRVEKITPTVTSKGTGDKPGVPDVTKDDLTEKEEVKEDDKEEDEFDHTPSHTDDKDDVNLVSKSDDEVKGDEEKGMDDTTNQFNDDVGARVNEPTQTDKEVVQDEGADAEMNDAQQRNENLVITQQQVLDDAHVTISTVTKKTKVPVTSSSRSSDLTSKFLNFLDIPHADAKIISPLDVHVHHKVPSNQTPTLLLPVSVIPESSPVFTAIPKSLPSLSPLPLLTTPTPPPTIATINPLSTLPDFLLITTLEKEVAKLKKDPIHTQVTTLVDEHLESRLGETREEFMNLLSESLTTRIKEQVKEQLPRILPKEVSNFAPPVIEALIKESRDKVTLAKVSSQPHSTYEAASTLMKFELKKILIDKIEKSESYLAAPEHQDCYDNKDKDEDPSAGSNRGLKRKKTSKDAETTIGLKNKDSKSGSSKSSKSQPKSAKKFVQSEEPEFEVADSDMLQDQERNLGNDDAEPRKNAAPR